MQLWGRVLEDGYNGRSWRGCQGLLHGRRGTVAGGEFVDAAPRERVEFVNASMLRQRDGTGAGMLRPLLHCCGKVAPRYPCWTLKKEELPRGGDVGVDGYRLIFVSSTGRGLTLDLSPDSRDGGLTVNCS